MTVSIGVWILVAAVVVALGFGLYRRMTDGRVRPASRDDESVEPAGSDSVWTALEPVADREPGATATLVQFSSAFCAPCRVTRVVLSDVAAKVPGVVHVEIDAEKHLDVVRTLRVLRTPTTLILDSQGHEVGRASGAPRVDQVLAALPVSNSRQES